MAKIAGLKMAAKSLRNSQGFHHASTQPHAPNATINAKQTQPSIATRAQGNNFSNIHQSNCQPSTIYIP